MSHTTLVNLSLGAARGGNVTAEANAIAFSESSTLASANVRRVEQAGQLSDF